MVAKIDRCGVCESDFPIAWHDGSTECLRPDRHKGPHCGVREDGQWLLWQKQLCDDLACEGCYGLEADSFEDVCSTTVYVEKAAARLYCDDPTLVGEGWDDA